MSSTKTRIIEIIKSKELSDLKEGLFDGNIGLCIYYYCFSKTVGNSEYESKADEILDKVFESLTTSSSINFANGLAGIGWGIEYLVQNGFAEGDTDDILEEIDNKIFRLLNEANITNINLADGLTGYLFYLISRLQNLSEPPSMAQIINSELLILSINKLDILVTSQFSTIVKDIYFDLFWRFSILFYGLCEAFKLNIYSEKISCMIKQWLPNIEAYIPSMHINRIYLAVMLTKINELMPNKRLEKQVQILMYATDFEELKTEVDGHQLNIQFGWPGFGWLLKCAAEILPKTVPNYELISLTANEIVTKYEITLDRVLEKNELDKNVKLGLADGLAGIGLFEILWPDIFECNN